MLGPEGCYTPTSPPLSGLQMRRKNKDRDIKQVTQDRTAHQQLSRDQSLALDTLLLLHDR